MTIRTSLSIATNRASLLLGLLVAFPGCASQPPATAAATPSTATPSTVPAATAATTSEPSPKLSNAELIAIERAPGTTAPLPHGVEPPPTAVAGLSGTPGPSPAVGKEDAPVRVDVFSDFECPVCPRVVEPLKYLARAHPDDVRIVFHQYALPRHNSAAALAAGSLAAFRQGKFWEYHDRVFAARRAGRTADPVGEAEAIGLSLDRFRTDMADEAVLDQVKYESELAKSIGLSGTPSLVINGRIMKGWGSYMVVESAVNRELERAQELADEGVAAERLAYEATRRSQPDGEKLAAALFRGGK